MRLANHEKWMKLALSLAHRGRLTVSPNPQVGACVVRNGKLVGSGYHKKFGGPHAEFYALHRAGRKARGATLYVTLEPCTTWQKTPPCAPLIQEKGIRRVVIGCLDPNPSHHRKGVRFLRQHGISVQVGILEDKVKNQNEGFFAFMKKRRPLVTLKMAQTLDGKIATRKGLSRWVSSAPSRAFVHQLRLEHDAVLVGKNTFYQDDPRLTVSKKSPAFQAGKPWKVVMVSEKGWSPESRVFKDSRLTIFVFPERHLRTISKKMNAPKSTVMLLPIREKRGRLDIKALLTKLGALGVTKLLVEGGGELAWSFLESGCVDRAYWILAPKIFGGRTAKTSVEGIGVTEPSQAFDFKAEKIFRSGNDWILKGIFTKKKNRRR